MRYCNIDYNSSVDMEKVSQSIIILILYQLLHLTSYSTNYLVYSYYQGNISRVVSTIILIATYYAIQLENYYPCAMLVIMPSFLQYQLTSIFILLGKYIQSSQYYNRYRSILCYIARVLLSSYYNSYYAQLPIELVNQHIYFIRSIYLEQLVQLSLQENIILYSQGTTIFMLYQVSCLAFYSISYLVYLNYNSMCLEQLVLLFLSRHIILLVKILPFLFYISYYALLSLVLVNQHIYTIKNIFLQQLVILSSKVCIVLYNQSTTSLVLNQL